MQVISRQEHEGHNPSDAGRRPFTFREDAEVAEAVQAAVRAFDFPSAHHYGLLLSCNTSTPLDAGRTLPSYDIRDGAVLFLTITSC